MRATPPLNSCPGLGVCATHLMGVEGGPRYRMLLQVCFRRVSMCRNFCDISAKTCRRYKGTRCKVFIFVGEGHGLLRLICGEPKGRPQSEWQKKVRGFSEVIVNQNGGRTLQLPIQVGGGLTPNLHFGHPLNPGATGLCMADVTDLGWNPPCGSDHSCRHTIILCRQSKSTSLHDFDSGTRSAGSPTGVPAVFGGWGARPSRGLGLPKLAVCHFFLWPRWGTLSRGGGRAAPFSLRTWGSNHHLHINQQQQSTTTK